VRRARVFATGLLGLLAVLLAAALMPASAHATFPGKNGKIAFSDSGPVVYTVNPDGSNPTPIHSGYDPAWSPDGKTIAFVSGSLRLVDADGSNARVIFTPSAGYALEAPTWSPDGKKLAFAEYTCSGPAGCFFTIATVNADGTGFSPIATGQDPDWSPDGSRVVFYSGPFDNQPSDIYTVRPDGTGSQRLTFDGDNGWSAFPSWLPAGNKILFDRYVQIAAVYSINADGTGRTKVADGDLRHPTSSPDGTRIAFTTFNFSTNKTELYTMNTDGTGQTKLFSDLYSLSDISWQPIPINGYPRPKGAAQASTNLTVAYEPCGSANRQHAPPLAGLSCAPPTQTSDYLTVGTLDANQQKANSAGLVQYDVMPGNLATPPDEADLKLTVLIKDIRKKDLSDYPGELSVATSRRITDKDSAPAPNGGTGAATVQDLPFAATVPCATTSDTTIGSLCELTTTADTLVPSSVKEGMRSIWELSPIQVYDGGADGDADTAADNTLFMDEGIFVP
jgi:WD40 repeat protein